jgi:N-acetylmuramoyl-L-alanine amidase
MRLINKIIIHCTATKECQVVSVADVIKWHKARGFNTIGYHYLVGLNGEVWEGRKEGIVGAHTEGLNAKSIGICYVGGLDASLKPKDTRTKAQRESLQKLVKELKERYLQATVHGHNEFAKKACPCFDVSKEF